MGTQWMKHRCLLALGVALFAMGLSGCLWDSGKYDAFTNDGRVEPCPGFDRLVMGDGTICEKGIDYTNCDNVGECNGGGVNVGRRAAHALTFGS